MSRFYYLVLGACGIQESDVKIKVTAANSVALFSEIMCMLRNSNKRFYTELTKLTTKSSFGEKVLSVTKVYSEELFFLSTALEYDTRCLTIICVMPHAELFTEEKPQAEPHNYTNGTTCMQRNRSSWL